MSDSDAGGMGFADRCLSAAEVERVCGEALESWPVTGKRVLVLIPDSTRTCPLDRLFPLLYKGLAPRAKSLTFLVALGTHPPMSEDRIHAMIGIDRAAHRTLYPRAELRNHAWKDPEALVRVGALSSAEVARITGGLFEMDVDIACNRLVVEHDLLLIVGPVFPHEVVGFSGGNKYLFPGVAGQEVIDFFHWLGAVITSMKIIGRKNTPVRAVVDRAASLLPVERRALCLVTDPAGTHGGGGSGLAGLYYGTPEAAWSAAADLSARVHVRYVEKPFREVLSCAPAMYDDLWTGGKCMYKMEPVTADGGRLIIYAPHITEISSVHGRVLQEIGYHTRDFFLKQWDRYRRYPWGVVAHSTHVKGIGEYENGIEKARIEVILATGIPESVCRRVNLGYMDSGAISPDRYGAEDEGVLCCHKAGEILYRLGSEDGSKAGKAGDGDER